MTTRKLKCLMAVGAISFCISTPALAADPATDVVEALRSNGCVASSPPELDKVVGNVLASVGPKEMDRIMDGLLKDGSVWRERGIGMVLHPRHCGSNAHLLGHQADGEKLRGIIRENGCSMTEADAKRMLPASGLERRAVGKIVESWTKEGIASVKGGTLVLDRSGC